MTSPLAGRPGAVPVTGPDAGLAWHYGNPTAEQRALAAGQALSDLSNREVVTLTGPERLTWLDTLSTQWLRDLPAGQSRETLILSPNGHIENALHVVDDGETTWITVEPGAGGPLVQHLERMKFMTRVEIADRSAEFAVLGYQPGEIETALNGLAEIAPVWVDPWPGLVGDTVSYNAVDDAEHPGRRRPWRERLVRRADVGTIGEVPLAGTWASDALRVEAWRPRFGFETDHRTIPHELDWLRTAVHLHKGCYRGQETVARVHNLGKPPRRLVLLHLDGSEHVVPEVGAEVVAGSRTVGRLTTVARHHELGPIALAVIKRNVSSEEELVVDGLAAAQELVVQR